MWCWWLCRLLLTLFFGFYVGAEVGKQQYHYHPCPMCEGGREGERTQTDTQRERGMDRWVDPHTIHPSIASIRQAGPMGGGTKKKKHSPSIQQEGVSGWLTG